MVSIVVDHEKETVHLPTRIRGVYPVEKRLLVRSGIPMPVRWVKVNDLSPLWPASYFREEMLAAAQSWTSQMTKRGYELATHEGDIQVCGPYKEHPWGSAGGTNPVAGGMTDAEGHQSETADFLLYADFIATRGKVYAEDHERMDRLFGKDYDRVLKSTNYDVLAAVAQLEGRSGPSQAAQVATELLIDRERKAMAPYGGY